MSDLPATSEDEGIDAILVPGTTYYAAIFGADPTAAGTNPTAGIVRQAVVFAAAAGGSKPAVTATFTGMPAMAGGAWVGIFSALTGGTFVWGDPTAVTTDAIPAGATLDVTITASLS